MNTKTALSWTIAPYIRKWVDEGAVQCWEKHMQTLLRSLQPDISPSAEDCRQVLTKWDHEFGSPDFFKRIFKKTRVLLEELPPPKPAPNNDDALWDIVLRTGWPQVSRAKEKLALSHRSTEYEATLTIRMASNYVLVVGPLWKIRAHYQRLKAQGGAAVVCSEDYEGSRNQFKVL